MVEQTIRLGGAGKEVNFILDLDPQVQPDRFLLQHFQRGWCYEPEIAWVLFRALREGDLAIDVGANIGFFTVLMSRLVGDSGRVIACEPGTNNLASFRQHMTVNNASNVTIINKPVWSEAGPLTFYLNADDRSTNSAFDPAQYDWNPKAKISPQVSTMQAITIDELSQDLSAVRLIKIDTEGAELRVLEGAKKTLEKLKPPFVVAELNPLGMKQIDCTAENLREFMREFGYDTFFLHKLDQLPTFVPRSTKIIYKEEARVINVLFSTLDRVAAAWPEITG